jgi:hypothetical protein
MAKSKPMKTSVARTPPAARPAQSAPVEEFLELLARLIARRHLAGESDPIPAATQLPRKAARRRRQ